MTDSIVMAFQSIVAIAVVFGVIGAVLSALDKSFFHSESGRRKQRSTDDRVPLSRARKFTLGAALVVVLAAPMHLAVVSSYDYFSIQPEFQRHVHGHVLNAYYANTPELMIQELQAAKTGMLDLDLQPTEYSTLLPWQMTPDNKMDYQYQILDSVIERIQAVKADRDRQTQQGGSDQLGDVYEQKMDNLRSFLQEDGWIDDIGQGAFVIHHHPYVAWWDNWGPWTIIPWLGAVGIGAAALFLPRKEAEAEGVSA